MTFYQFFDHHRIFTLMMTSKRKPSWSQLDESILTTDPDKIFENRSIDQIKDLYVT